MYVYAIKATITVDGTGYPLPTFYMHPDVLTPTHAEGIARDIINPFNLFNTEIEVVAINVPND